MKYSVSNWIYGNEPIEKSVERLVKYGYDGIEIRGEPAEYDVKKLKDLFSSNNLEVSTVCGMWPWDDADHMKTRDLANPDPKVRERGIKYGESALEFGNKLDSKTFICVVGGCGKVKQLHEKEWEYGRFKVQAYSCSCGTRFREYKTDGKHSFTLKLQKGRGFIKA